MTRTFAAIAGPWDYFRATPFGELLTGTAHQAHPTDMTAPLGARFNGQTILAIHIALEKAATVRVAFGNDGSPRLSGIRDIKQRGTGEFQDTVRSEAKATGAKWAVVVFATGWQAVLGQRAARPEPNDRTGRFARHRLMFDSPEVVVPRAQVDRVYTAVDHPVLDKSVVFSVRRRELEELFASIHACGLGIAAARLTVAAQLESWLSTQGEGGLARDLLISDGLSGILLNTEQGDFMAPRGAVETEQPRQSVQRPGAIEEDIVRFIKANAARSLTFLGPEELCIAIKKQAPDLEILRPPDHPAQNTETIALTAWTGHDLNFEAKEVRPALPMAWRRFTFAYAALSSVFALLAAVNAFYAARTDFVSYRLEKYIVAQRQDGARDAARTARAERELSAARALRAWVASNYHAQPFCYSLLKVVPVTAALDKLAVELHDGQITLAFAVLGDQDTQLATRRAIEGAINRLQYRIGGEDLPVVTPGAFPAVQYRFHIIPPDAGETALE